MPRPRSAILLVRLLQTEFARGLVLGGGLLAVCGGCRSNNDLVEAELRARESQVHHLKSELVRSEAYNEALQREMQDMHRGCASGSTGVPSEVYSVKDVQLGRLTGGYNVDDRPGDEALQVVLEPRDPDGSAIKASGTLHVVAFEVNSQGLKRPFSSWDISGDQLRRSWKAGLFTTGYQLILPWQSWPTSEHVRVLAQFTLADGRLFEADRDVTVHLPPQRQPAPVGPVVPIVPAPAGPAPVGPAPLEELPVPNKAPIIPPLPVPIKDGPLETTSLRPAEILRPLPLPRQPR